MDIVIVMVVGIGMRIVTASDKVLVVVSVTHTRPSIMAVVVALVATFTAIVSVVGMVMVIESQSQQQ